MNLPLARSLLAVSAMALIATSLGAAETQDIAAELKGKLVALDGKKTKTFDDSSLSQDKYFALYFSAGWCPPCHKFTPSLVSFYNEMKPKNPNFEVIFMSSDRSEDAMEKYMAEMSMPWPALKFSSIKSKKDLTKYAGPGIPCLVVLNEKGEVLSHSYEGEKYVGPSKVMADLKKLLAAGGEAASPGAASTATGKPAGTRSPTGSNFDEIFKKKP